MASDNAAVSMIASDDDATFTLAARHTGREGILIYNGSNKVLYVKFGEDCQADDYSFQLAAASWYESPFGTSYTGIVTGLSDTNPTGDISVTEVTG